MPNYKLPGSKTVHSKRDCHGLRAANSLAGLTETEEPPTCRYCLGTYKPGPQTRKATVATLVPPGVVIPPPAPPKWSAILKQHALATLEIAILMEREGL